ncbi:hypothetical protein IQ235_07745 [Oscillatoriales cyanobacterium LEGE 11467]|uniref:Uncharacterized protein n=1 Tax=Zarconia navalis LEGE 11467 TaxID=1828826 RepID=A0A928Z6R6_9CYAN|nr:hypothetical protein [Zarconia navalis]MBE9040672.1 hypothetical protein [Zarconia navalis LEGE 11467]
MIISDLNHLEIVSEETKVVGGWGGTFANIDFDKDVNIDFDSDVDVDIDISGEANVDGVVLNAEASFTIAGHYDDAAGSAEAGVFAEDGFYSGFANASIGIS